MENFTVQDYVKLLKFYKDKVSDLELQYLTLQINASKELQIKVEDAVKETRKSLEKELSEAQTRVKSLELTLIEKKGKRGPIKKKTK